MIFFYCYQLIPCSGHPKCITVTSNDAFLFISCFCLMGFNVTLTFEVISPRILIVAVILGPLSCHTGTPCRRHWTWHPPCHSIKTRGRPVVVLSIEIERLLRPVVSAVPLYHPADIKERQACPVLSSVPLCPWWIFTVPLYPPTDTMERLQRSIVSNVPLCPKCYSSFRCVHMER